MSLQFGVNIPVQRCARLHVHVIHCAYYRASKPFRISAWFRQPSSKRDFIHFQAVWLRNTSLAQALQCWHLVNTVGLYEIKYCDWNNVVCCVGFTSASSVQLHGNYSQWHWHSSGSDRPWHATCGCAGNTELVTVNKWVLTLVKLFCTQSSSKPLLKFITQCQIIIQCRVGNGKDFQPVICQFTKF